MKKRLLVLVLVFLLTFSVTASVTAQSYSFSLTQEKVHVYWNSDGTIAVDYVFTFANDPGAHVIDFVDVGMPNGNFSMSSITADVDGNQVSISSDFQGDGSYGFAVDMGSRAIQAGQSGMVHVYVGQIKKMLYKDSDEPDTYASGEFSPAYWTTAHGNTIMTVVFHLPPGVQPEEPRYHDQNIGWPCDTTPTADHDGEGRITYTWQCSNANAYTQYTFGASFPKQYIPADAIVSSAAANFDLGGLLSGLAGSFQTICCIGFFIFLFVGLPILSAINSRKRKLQYLPPKISIEGHGIKRGLTAVESAILMEQPLDKVMTMILFGVVKKGAATVVTRDPLKLQLTDPLPEGLHEYETEFLQAFAKDTLSDRRKSLQTMTINLVNAISAKMKGFSRKETVDYYKAIMERAWQQIEAAGTPEVKSQMYDEALEWTMLDKNYDERTRRVFTGPIFVPLWWGSYDPAFHPVSTGHTAAPSLSTSGSSGGRVSLPGASLAASMVTGVQGFSSKVLGDLSTFTSNVTNRTNPVPVSKSSGSSRSSGGGGHSCACACACAGCACACAGGGR